MQTYNSLSNSLKNQVVSPVYLFYGEETFLITETINQFKKALLSQSGLDSFNYDMLYGGECSAKQIIEAANNLPVFSAKRLVVVKDAPFFGSSASKEDVNLLLKYLEDPCTSTCLILQADAVDKRMKVFKEISKKQQVRYFGSLKGNELEKWAVGQLESRQQKISREALHYLLLAVGNDLQKLSLELDKCLNYIEPGTALQLDDVRQVISKTAEINIFLTVDNLGEKKITAALKEIKEMLIYGEVPLKILAMIIRQFNILLQIKEMTAQKLPAKEMAARIKIAPFVLEKCRRQAANFSKEELLDILHSLWQLDISQKSGEGQNFFASLQRIFMQLAV